ncbi:MAG: hypothetical protein IH612_01025, partial [Desulfofustis sp.]|nr:hypothetical protein [Desulfofustis sp.]
FMILAVLAVAVWAVPLTRASATQADESVSGTGQALLAKHATLTTDLEKNQFGMPLYLESIEESGSMSVDVFGILDSPFALVRDSLQTPDNWCDINLMLLNVKACTFRQASDQWVLTLYSGRKYYQAPKDAFELELNFQVTAMHKHYMSIELAGAAGPLGTRDHRISFEAAPLDKDRTFIHFRYDYRFGALARTAMVSYYATIGRNKKGFSADDIDAQGNPVYVDGARGSLERTVVRSYFAIQTFMDELETPDSQRFERQIQHWFDLTARFPRQLHEMDKGQYLANKRREHANQLRLQKALN